MLQQLFFQGFDDFQSLVLIRDELLKFFGIQRTIGSCLDGEVRGFLAEHVLVVVDLREIAAALIRFGDGDGAASATVCVGGIVDSNLITTDRVGVAGVAVTVGFLVQFLDLNHFHFVVHLSFTVSIYYHTYAWLSRCILHNY